MGYLFLLAASVRSQARVRRRISGRFHYHWSFDRSRSLQGGSVRLLGKETMRYTYPHYKSKHECIVPDLSKWQQLREGMTFDEVTALIGPPIRDPLTGSNPDDVDDAHLCYGWIDVPGVPHPRTYAFSVGFEDRRLCSKESPFGDDYSADGVPAAPRIIAPVDDPKYDHYPRIIDVRWRPAAGQYPMRFEVQLGIADSEDEHYIHRTEDNDLSGLHYCMDFPGAQPGRVRVRGSNSLGTGPWSEFWYFEFLQ